MGLGEWLEKEATPERREVPLCLDRRLLGRLVQLRKAEKDEPKMLGRDRSEIEQVEREVAAKTHVVVIEGLGWGRWRDLEAQYPPEPDQLDTFKRAVQLGYMPHALENLRFDAEGFVPAAISACAVDPKITIEEAREFLESPAVPPGVIDRLWSAVLEVNFGGQDDPFVGALERAQPSAKNSKPPSPLVSLDRSSSGA